MLEILSVSSYLLLASLAQSAAPATAATGPTRGTLEIGGAPVRIVDLQANTFTSSSQEWATLAVDANGRTTVVWQSRRQEDNNYGVYAQRFDARGGRLGLETHINGYAPDPQVSPCIVGDAGGAYWFAWISFQQDGSAGGIVARRFDAELATSTPEVIVNEEHAGDQGEVALACDSQGNALVAWTTPGVIREQRLLRARRMLPDGTPAGPSFLVAGDSGEIVRNPVVAFDAAGGFTLAWARADASGRPNGIRARSYTAAGAAGPEWALGPALAPGGSEMPIEPVIEFAPAGELVAGWLVADGDDYVPVLRRSRFDATAGTWLGGPIVRVPTDPEGYVSALELVLLADGDALLVWNQNVDRQSDVVGARIDAQGNIGEVLGLTATREGDQALKVGPGGRRVAPRPDGGLALAWSGYSGHQDASAANLTLIVPVGSTALETGTPPADLPPVRFGGADERGAAPHDPPVEDASGELRREDFLANEDLTAGGPDFGFLGVPQTNLTPPDPHIAVGPGHVVETLNAVVAVFTKSGTMTFQQAMSGTSGFWVAAGAPSSAFVFDPEVVYDAASGRFFVMANERSSGQSFFDLAVSDDSDPNGAWFKYRFQTPAILGDIDSPNLAVGANEVYLTADFFNPDRYFVLAVDKAPLLSGGAPTTNNTTIAGFQSHGLPMAYSPSGVQYLVEALEAASNTTIRLHAILNPLTAPTIQTFTLPVPTYQQPEDPPQMGTSVRPNTFESRFWSCMFRNGSIWATHHTGSARVLQRWYQIDMQGWPSSGFNPVLVQTGNIDPGAGIRTFFGSIFADSQNNVGLVFARSSPTEFISMSRTFRLAGDAPGTTQPPVFMKTSTSPDTTGRWGDYSAVVGDPGADLVFWGGHEFRGASGWGTWIGTFGPCLQAPTTYCTSKQTSLGLFPAISSSGDASLGTNAFQLSMTNGMPNTTVLYFHGPGPASIPWFNGTLCVAAPLVRGPAGNFDGAGNVTMPFPVPPDLLGTERYFQFWFRDPLHPDGTGTGMSDGLRVRICP